MNKEGDKKVEKAFGENRLRVMRDSRELTQEQLADLIGVKKAAISRWENSKRKLNSDTQRRLANALQCGIGELWEISAQQLTPDEQALLDKYRGMSDSARTSFQAVGAAFAQQPPAEPSEPPPLAGQTVKKAG
ncbi:MAG: helix-turn-helix transcriptional regulator [Rhodospirillales bacterium]